MLDPALAHVAPTNDLRQLQMIHFRLFQDVYEWAGKLRTVDIRKSGDARAEFFMPSSRILGGAAFVFTELAEEDHLQGLSRERFIERLSHHYDQVNYLHPFREGNGRTQRIFWNQIAARAGYTLDWQQTTGVINDQSCRDAMECQDFARLRAMFDSITVAADTDAEPSGAERERLRFMMAVNFPASRESQSVQPGDLEAGAYRPPARDVGRER